MKTKIILTSFFLLIGYTLLAQGHIDHIKNQPYLKSKSMVDCNNLSGDNLSERICANLSFQRKDSLLTLVYDSLLAKTKGHYIDSLEQKIIRMQETWRSLRDQHCAIIYTGYEGSASGNLQAIDYLYCLTELTENRIKELRKLNSTIQAP
ncbi:MAG: lysozyme inhibitor LprI family protein [Flavobacteriales bacterium]